MYFYLVCFILVKVALKCSAAWGEHMVRQRCYTFGRVLMSHSDILVFFPKLLGAGLPIETMVATILFPDFVDNNP